jgi:CelD/BcsL family acetyltransferase involved in cellulose biosynthesis
MFSTHIIKTIDEFKTISESWRGLLQDAQESNIALDHAWLLTWLTHFLPQQIFVVLVYDDQKKLVAAAPFQIQRIPSGLARRLLRRLQFIGTDPSVYDDIKILCTKTIDKSTVFQSIAKCLLDARLLWDVLDLRYSSDKEGLVLLESYLFHGTYSSQMDSPMSIPILKLPETIEAYTQTKSKSFHKDIRRIYNRLEREYPKEEVTLSFLPASPETDIKMASFLQNHQDYWKAKGVKTETVRFPELKSFYQSIHAHYQSSKERHGRFHFSVLSLGDIPLSYQFCYWQGRHYLGYLTHYNPDYKPYRPGILHIESLIHHVIEEGAEAFEFGRGDEPYKSQWTKSLLPLWNLTMFKTARAAWTWQLDHEIQKRLNRA